MAFSRFNTEIDLSISRHADVLTLLLDQPNELIGEVLQWLALGDLLSLRLVNRRLHRLIHNYDEAICRHFCQRLRNIHPALIISERRHGDNHDLLYLAEIQRRYEVIDRLADILAERVITKVILRNLGPIDEGESAWRARKQFNLRRKLLPPLFTFNNFLEDLKRIMIDGDNSFACFDNETYLAMHDVYDIDQQRLISNILRRTGQNLGDISAAFGVLQGVLRAKYPPSASQYYGFRHAEFQHALITWGVMLFSRLLSAWDDDSERTRDFAQLLGQYGRATDRRPFKYIGRRQHSICHLDTERYVLPEPHRKRQINVQYQFSDKQDLWNKAAHAVVQREGSEEISANISDWLRKALHEDNDPQWELGAWNKPDPP